MTDWTRSILEATGTVTAAIAIIDGSEAKICLVVDERGRLIGTVTDGDVRRGLLRAVPLDAPVTQVMRQKPHIGQPGEPADDLHERMRRLDIAQIPLVDGAGRVVGLVTAKEVGSSAARRDEWVVLMAGGAGQRLRPYTDTVPKPMLEVGRKPVLETILENFLSHGFHRFYISVNYKAEVVKAHFGDGGRWHCQIEYLEETQRLGTAGALSLLRERPRTPLIVMNGDVLTKIDFSSLLEFHFHHRAKATMCVREYDIHVPFGVVDLGDGLVTGIDEKPVKRFFVNAGIYVLEPEILGIVPRETACDMPDLLNQVRAGGRVVAFPIREYWLDIGRIEDLARADAEFKDVFG